MARADRLMLRLASRTGRAGDLAWAYSGTALVLAVLGVLLINSGATRSWPRHTDFGLFVLLCAAGAMIYALVNRQRALVLAQTVQGRLRPGEKMIGNFPGRLARDPEDGQPRVGPPVVLVITNQRLMLYRPNRGLDLGAERELDEVAGARDLGPVSGPCLQACVLVGITFADGSELDLIMNLAVAHEMAPVRGWYLNQLPRRIRALVVHTDGPTPARPAEMLDTILDAGRPALRPFVLEDHYLRVLGDGAAPMTELWWYFHWEHMQVGKLQPPDYPGVPKDWLSLRLVFHERSSMVVCGRPGGMRRLRDKALSAGARELPPPAPAPP